MTRCITSRLWTMQISVVFFKSPYWSTIVINYVRAHWRRPPTIVRHTLPFHSAPTAIYDTLVRRILPTTTSDKERKREQMKKNQTKQRNGTLINIIVLSHRRISMLSHPRHFYFTEDFVVGAWRAVTFATFICPVVGLSFLTRGSTPPKPSIKTTSRPLTTRSTQWTMIGNHYWTTATSCRLP